MFSDSYLNKDKADIITISHRRVKDIFIKPINYSFTQIKISWIILHRCHDYTKCIFFLGGDGLIIPIILCKALNKEVFLCLGGMGSRVLKQTNDPLYPIYKIISHLSYILANKIILYTPRLIQAWNLEDYESSISIAHRHFLDFETFAVTTSFPDRPPLIGYIGRLSKEKGTEQFVHSLPAIFIERQNLRVLIGGDGQLKESIEASLNEEGIAARVDLPGWISHNDLPRYLNQLRLLVLPSYTEGLPNIMLEAMACGTPVLATSVGAVPDVIIDGKTGFILEDNSPESIAESVARALSSPDLERIAEAGRRFVEENFTFERVVERWKEVLDEI